MNIFAFSTAILRELWIIPLFFALVTGASMMVAFCLGWVFKLKRSQRNFAMAASMFMNTNSLPVALMQSLVVSIPSLRWGDNDTTGAMTGRAFTYLVLYSSLSMMLRWSYGVHLLSSPDDPEPQTLLDERTPLLAPFADNPQPSSFTLIEDEVPSTPPYRHKPRRRTTFFKSFPNSPTQERAVLPSVDSTPPPSPPSTPSEASDSDAEELPVHNLEQRPPSAFFHRVKRRIRRGWVALNDFMTMALWATLASLFVACVRPLQHLLDNHLEPVKGALATAGNCSIPLTLVVLGAFFYSPPKEEDSGESAGALSASRSTDSLADHFRDLVFFKRRRLVRRSSQPVTPGETKTVIITVISRMFITPLLMLPLMALSTKFDWHKVLEDPVFIVANVLVLSSPPALTLAQISQVASGDTFERLISSTLFWSYCIITPPATIIYVVVGLIVAKL